MSTPSTENQPGLARVPPGTKKIIIFDTNAYREFSHGSLADCRARAVHLRQCEQANSSYVLASPTVICELIAHLADSNDPAFNYCLKSLIVLREHAVNSNYPEGGINLFSDAESTVCRQLFHAIPSQNEKVTRSLSSLVRQIAKHASDLSESGAQEHIKHIASIVDATEQQWLKLMEEVLARCDPKAVKQFFGDIGDGEVRKKMRDFFATQRFVDMWAEFMVGIHAAKVGKTISSGDELKEKSKILQKVFPVSFHLMSVLLQKIAMDKDFNLSNPNKKRWNFVWDSQLTFSIGAAHIIAGAPIFVVTSDGEVLGAAKAAKCEDRVLPLKDYLASVGF